MDQSNDEVCEASNSSTGLAVMALNDTKAGMSGLDTERINAIIAEASKGSKFYQAKEKSQERISKQVEAMKTAAAKLTQAEVAKAEKEMDLIASELIAARILDRTIVHVDMDQFYAAVEIRDDPSLKDKPMAVGGMGMLSTSNYAARKFGVRAGMPGFIGRKLCPELILVPLNFAKYREVSEVVRGVFREYDPNFSPMSLDEAYLDITNHLKGFPDKSADQVVEEIRTKIQERTNGLTASAGIAPNSLLAKVCSDQNKPNGQFRLRGDAEEVMAFVEKLPIRKVSGIGNVTEQLLKALDIQNCKDLFDKRGLVKLLFSDISSLSFLKISLGIGSTKLSEWTERERKSLSTETTFRDCDKPDQLFDICHGLCNELSEDLIKRGLQGRAVTLKIKTHAFKTRTKVQNLLDFTNESGVIESAAKSLLRLFMETSEEKPLKLRLMGVRASDFKQETAMDTDDDQKVQVQTKLDSFLRQTGELSKEKTYPCPICHQEIRARSESAFNVHLDSCLERDHQEPPKAEAEESLKRVDGGRKDERVSVSCPICEKHLGSDPDSDHVHTHIDQCLATGPPVKRRCDESSRNRSKSIKTFFTSSI